MSRVREIFIARAGGAPMTQTDQVRAVAGQGLEGDRYAAGVGTFSRKDSKHDRHVTLIEAENVEAFAQSTGLPFTTVMTRRNVVTEGVRLNDLAGKIFKIGDVRIRGIRLCEPCKILARQSFAEILPAMNGKSGLRAEILTDGIIRVGDVIVPC